MSIPYRARRTLRSLAVTVLVLILLAAGLLSLWLLWLNRYVVYTRDGVELNFDISLNFSQGETPQQPDPAPTVSIHSASDAEATDPDGEIIPANQLTRFSGYSVTLEELAGDLEGTREKLLALPAGSTVVLELKDVKGTAYYSSSFARSPTGFDTALVDQLILELQSRDFYLIARIPAFQEYHYFLADERGRVPYGLPKAGGNGSLWLDSDGPCYWLNPASEGTITYLIQLISELRGMGFDEVVLSDFRFPNTDSISFSGDKMEALNTTAATLVKTCTTDSFCLSFIRSSADLTLPEGRTRLYLTGVAAADLDSQAAKTGFEDPTIQLVFLTDSADTRYDDYCVLRPLSQSHE